jgi:hypothetical protein
MQAGIRPQVPFSTIHRGCGVAHARIAGETILRQHLQFRTWLGDEKAIESGSEIKTPSDCDTGRNHDIAIDKSDSADW